MPRFSILHLLAFTALVAVGCVALLNSSPICAASLMGGVVLTLAASVLLAIFRDANQRAYWIGFAFAGWLYLLLTFGPISDERPFGSTGSITGRAGLALYNRMHLRPDPDPNDPFATPSVPDRTAFLYVAHALWTVLFALLGGLFAHWLYDSRKKTTGDG